MVAGFTVDKPWIAVDPHSGEVYVGYEAGFLDPPPLGNPVQVVASTDGGVAWSAPVNLSVGWADGVQLPSGFVRRPRRQLARIRYREFDPVRPLDQSRRELRSHGGGRTELLVLALNRAERIRTLSIPAMAIDSFSDAYTGRLFVVWENGSGGVAGSPTIELSWSSDNGTNWSNPISVASNFALENFEPSVAVAGDGSVYVVWYGENPSTGDYDLYGATSTDGGVMFGPQYVVSDVPSDPNFPDGNASYSAPWIGDYSGIVGDALGARPIWTDARSSLAHGPCDLCVQAPVAYNISLYSSLLVNATLSATIPVNVTVEGAVQGNGSAALSPRPTRLTWLAGAPYWIDAPAAVTWNSTTWVFRGWLGTNGGSVANLSGTVAPAPCVSPRATRSPRVRPARARVSSPFT